MKQRFDLIVFDWDGTLMDSVDWITHCIQQAAAAAGQPIPSEQAAKDIIGLSIENAIATLFPAVNAETRAFITEEYAKEFHGKTAGPDDLFPGVTDMLLTLRAQNKRLAVATGKKAAGLRLVMRASGVQDLFCATRSADQTASKPNPLMLLELMAELGVEKQRTLMVGDSAHDMQMAKNAGIAAIGVTCGAHSAEVLRRHQPLACLNYPTDLLEFI